MNPPQPERRRGGPPSDPNDDVLGEIFLRIPPDDPTVLVRLSAVCSRWRRLLTDPDFLRSYRILHGPPPILGFFCEPKVCSGFIPTTAFRPIVPSRSVRWLPCDSRHGRALFIRDPESSQLLALDPMTGAERLLRVPEIWSYMSWTWSASVFCAVGGCNHLNCHGGPFRVALVGTDFWKPTIAAVYSSETDAWSDPTYIGPPNFISLPRAASVLVGNALYVLCCGNNILEFDMATIRLAEISPPFVDYVYWCHACLVTAEGGGLGFAAIKGQTRLHLWSKEEATDRWNLCAVKDLETLLPRYAISPMIALIGFAEGVRVIVVRTCAGIFTIELGSSERVKVVTMRGEINAAFPFMSFCTPELMLEVLSSDAQFKQRREFTIGTI
ncbi:uncharacterized protein LOC107304316 isoform X1 [Oryza brachyantha]|uniref:uncharacterized protein LOC107304316 isoform X1 n=1 Tax=Oryza brachyantha TaxID=4533 RepID=UPI001ADAB7F1|nr:uncharacterized protein LOC107304316 isoform X1 [Oryza brachyantha]